MQLFHDGKRACMCGCPHLEEEGSQNSNPIKPALIINNAEMNLTMVCSSFFSISKIGNTCSGFQNQI